MLEQDILVEIPDDDLPELLEMYEKHKSTIPHIYSTIFTGIQWRNKLKEKYLRFFSPNNCWREDGTFFVILMQYSFELLCYSFDESGRSIHEAIMKTKLLDDPKATSILFYAIYYKFYPIVSKAIEHRRLVKEKTRRIDIPNYMFNIPKEEALKFIFDCPPEVYIKELDKSYAYLINAMWPPRYQGSEKLISLLLEMNGGYGVFLKSTNELVTWVLLSMMGQLTILQTVAEHKKKGYASLITKYTSRELAKKGYNPFGTVAAKNTPSVNLFEKLGFKSLEMPEQDILVEIPDDDLPELLQMYEKHKDTVPNIYSTIFTGIQWRNKKKGKYLRFMSPNNCWREDGTFFVLLMYYSFDLVFFSLDESGKNIYEGIMKTKILDEDCYKDRAFLFYVVHYKFLPIVSKAIKDRGFVEHTGVADQFRMFNIKKEAALNFVIDCPPDVYIKELDKSHASFMNSIWPHRYQNSEKFVSLLLEMNGGYGIFLRSTNELVAWVVSSMMGTLSMLQTVDGHKKKGYASLITKYMSRELARKGYNPFGTVLVDNYASISMFKKLGFESLGLARCILLSKKDKVTS